MKKRLLISLTSIMMGMLLITGCGNELKTTVCEQSIVEDGIDTDAILSLNYSGNVIKSAEVKVIMNVGSSLMDYVLPTMESRITLYEGIKGITFSVSADGDDLVVVQEVDMAKFSQEEADKLADKLGEDPVDFFEEDYFDGKKLNYEKYKQYLIDDGFTCK